MNRDLFVPIAWCVGLGIVPFLGASLFHRHPLEALLAVCAAAGLIAQGLATTFLLAGEADRRAWPWWLALPIALAPVMLAAWAANTHPALAIVGELQPF
ncbi:MAG: hypothetical protein MUE77_12130 [Sandarakinorhabdus sp.]|nr:hypothetical protein [Sandarakinorhabdus sp.]